MIELVWLLDPNGMFEKDWIEYLFKDIPHSQYTDDHEDVRYRCPVFILNASMPYESYLLEYAEERTPFGVIHLSDETLVDTCNYLDLDMCVFAIRNYHHPLHSQHSKMITVGLGYKTGFHDPTNPQSLSVRSRDPWFHWCFIGAVHHQARHDAITTFLPIKPYILSVHTAGFNAHHLTIQQYKNTMLLSKFALCPIGQGNLDTFRVYEALEAGCVPVVLSKTIEQPYSPSYWHALFMLPSSSDIPFVMGNTWTECYQMMETLLQDPVKYYDLQAKMTQFWDSHKESWKQSIQAAVTQLKNACSL
jgi:hypothetical protein